jgi:Cu-Zn family superoxide dismutase
MKKQWLAIGVLGLLILPGLQGCTQKTEFSVDRNQNPVKEAIAVLHPVGDSGVTGTVHFERVTDGIRVTAEVTGLPPGKHGFHVHAYGDCSAPDATSAGGHYNPFDAVHGAPSNASRHEGDLGNLEADSLGVAHYDRVDELLRLNGPFSIVGRSMIVHAGEDDLTSQPTGNAGARVACGVIGITGQ